MLARDAAQAHGTHLELVVLVFVVPVLELAVMPVTVAVAVACSTSNNTVGQLWHLRTSAARQRGLRTAHASDEHRSTHCRSCNKTNAHITCETLTTQKQRVKSAVQSVSQSVSHLADQSVSQLDQSVKRSRFEDTQLPAGTG